MLGTELLFIISAGFDVLFRLRAGPNSGPSAGTDGSFEQQLCKQEVGCKQSL
jgi:hypothetical protein